MFANQTSEMILQFHLEAQFSMIYKISSNIVVGTKTIQLTEKFRAEQRDHEFVKQYPLHPSSNSCGMALFVAWAGGFTMVSILGRKQISQNLMLVTNFDSEHFLCCLPKSCLQGKDI